MKGKLFKLLRVIAVICGIALIALSSYQLISLQYDACREHLPDNVMAAAFTCGVVLIFLSLPIGAALIAHMGGWRLHTLQILFVQLTRKDKLRLRLVPRLGYYVRLLPPRTDGASPWGLRLFAGPIWLAALFVPLALASAITWQLPVARVFLILSLVCISGACLILLSAKNSLLQHALRFRRDKRYLQAFECAQHISVAAMDQMRLAAMPEAWFPALPANLLEDRYVRYVTFMRSSWLIRQEREPEGYDTLLPLLDLAPAPETYTTIAGAILNGAVVEALCSLPPRCLQLLDDPSVKYMTPAGWARAIKAAQYARALFLHHDEQEAAALLPELEKLITPEDDSARRTLRRLQEKAGLIPKEDAP